MGEGRTTSKRRKNLRARLAWCEMVLHILSLISEQDRAILKGKYPWPDSIGGATREQAGVKSQTGRHSDLFQAREQEAEAGGARGWLTTLAPGGSEQTLGQGEAAEKGPLNDRAKGRKPRSGTGIGQDSFCSEKDRTERISTSASASTTTNIQGCEVKAQLRPEKSAKGSHENQVSFPSPDLQASGNLQLPQGPRHGFKKSRGGGPGLKSGVGSAAPSVEEQELGHRLKKTRDGGSAVKSVVERSGPSGEEQGLGLGCKKTRGGASGVESAGPSGEEQGLKPGYKKTRGGGSAVKSAAEGMDPSGEEQGLRPRHKKTRGGSPVLKSGVESAGPSGEEQGLGPWKTKCEVPDLRSNVESAVPCGEKQKELEDQPFPDLQTEDKGELMTEKELAGPDNMGQPGIQSSQEVQGPQIIWTSPQKAEEDSEQFEDNTPDQSFQLRSEDEEGSPLRLTPLTMERPSSDSSYAQPSSTFIQPEVGEEALKAQLVQSPAVPLICHPVKMVPPGKEDREEKTPSKKWKEEEEYCIAWHLRACGATTWRSAMSLNLVSKSAQASSSAPVPSSPEKNWKRTELHRNSDRSNKTRPMTASSIRRLEGATQPLSCHIYRNDSDLTPIGSSIKEWKEEILTQKQEEAFREYFKFFCGPGEIDIHSLKSILSIVGIPQTQAEMTAALISADVNGDGRMDFRDFLSVLTDTHWFYRSNRTIALCQISEILILFEILSQLIEMLALPEASLEEITNYYQKKTKCMSKDKDHAVNTARQPHSHKRTFSRTSDIGPQEQKVLNIVDRIKQQNRSAFLQSPYVPQATSYLLCPPLDKKATRRRQGSHVVLEEYKPIDLTTDFRTFFQMGPKGGRELNPTL